MRFLCALVYLSPLLWSAQSHPAAAAKKRQASSQTISQFVGRLKSEGKPVGFTGPLARLMDFPAETESRALEIHAPDSADGRSRLAEVVLAKSAASGGLEPIGLYWSVTYEKNQKSEGYHYHTSVEGTIAKAVLLEGRLDENGKAIRGSGPVTKLDSESKEVPEKFRELVLDFWLKGKYRAKRKSK